MHEPRAAELCATLCVLCEEGEGNLRYAKSREPKSIIVTHMICSSSLSGVATTGQGRRVVLGVSK